MLNREEIMGWLRENDPERVAELYKQADDIRRENVGNAVYLRGLIEFSNMCSRNCGYCGIRIGNSSVKRYRMSPDEIMQCAKKAVSLGYGTVVLQAGEDRSLPVEWIVDVITQIKSLGVAVTLSLGERPMAEIKKFKQAGADRYLLRFETSDRDLFEKIHPSLPGERSDRIQILRELKEVGYETGSGILVGIPGQSYESVVDDILLFGDLGLHMLGVGPYIAHPQSPIDVEPLPEGQQVPTGVEMACKVVALARMACPKANIPSTTAIATLDGIAGRTQGLNCGANILMPNLTPQKYRELYEIYPSKAVLSEEGAAQSLADWFKTIGRYQGEGRGDSPAMCH